MVAFVILCIFAFFGSFVSNFFNIPIPGSVLGAIIFLIYAIIKRGFSDQFVKETNYLLVYMALLILPLCIKLLNTYQQFLHNAVGIVVSLVISTICGSIVTAKIFSMFLERERKKLLYKVLYASKPPSKKRKARKS